MNELPADSELGNFPRQVYHACYSRVTPTRVSQPQYLIVSEDAATLLELEQKDFRSQLFLDVFAGNTLLKGMMPYATCYGGHQFGQWAGQLGDGRVINLGEITNSAGEHWAIQLKGAGLTPYSRTADGLAVLRSSIREFLCSEAMFHLGIPTTRALSLMLTGEKVVRDMFYDGHVKEEPGAIVCRLAPSFTRFGNFQLMGERNGIPLLKKLVDFSIRNDFPQLSLHQNNKTSTAVYLQWFEEICRLTCEMIIHWMRVGFVHGVMNTDNMSILGLTMDYGPYGWLENFEPNWTPNTTDATHHRYAYSQQPKIAQWNLLQLANSLLPLVGTNKPFEEILAQTAITFDRKWHQMMLNKLGIAQYKPITDDILVSDLLKLLMSREIDMTLFFRELAKIDFHADDMQNVENCQAAIKILSNAFYDEKPLTAKEQTLFSSWFRKYRKRLFQENSDHQTKQRQMNLTNPLYVLRNYLAQQAIEEAENGDYTMVYELHELLKKPYQQQSDRVKYQTKRPEWARFKAGCSMLSCSS